MYNTGQMIQRRLLNDILQTTTQMENHKLTYTLPFWNANVVNSNKTHGARATCSFEL